MAKEGKDKESKIGIIEEIAGSRRSVHSPSSERIAFPGRRNKGPRAVNNPYQRLRLQTRHEKHVLRREIQAPA
jgi:hypothetical protein